MTTVVDALTDATAELHNAALLFQNRADQVATQLASFKASATTTINNYANRAPIVGIYIDANNGVDDLSDGRGGPNLPFATIDFALDNTDKSVTRVLYLLSDQIKRKWHALYGTVQICGVVRIANPFGSPFTPARRKLQFLGEATNSPRPDIGRCLPLFDMGGGGALGFQSIDVVLPMTAAGLNHKILVPTTGGSFFLLDGSLSVENAATQAVFFNNFTTQAIFGFSSWTNNSGVAGKIFGGIAAGVDPNTSFYYKTNLTSA